MTDIKSIIWGLVFLLIMVAWIGHGCKNRMEEFRERREERQQERKENWNQWRDQRQERREDRDQHQTIFDRWRERRESKTTP